MNEVNCVLVVEKLVKELGARVSGYSIKKRLSNHPDYPGMLSMADGLSNFGIPNIAFKVKPGFANKKDLPSPFICRLKSDNPGKFIVVTNISDGNVHFSDGKKNKLGISEENFYKEWDGIALYAEKDATSGEQLYFQNLVMGYLEKARLPFFISICVLSAIFFIGIEITNSKLWTNLLLKTAGLIFSIFLIGHSIDSKNPFIENLCSIGKKNGCNTILKSSAANLTDWLSWSEIGLFYFSFTITAIIFSPGSANILSWIALACLPYSFYSIGYQYLKKSWCVLCCSVQAILWLDAGAFALSGHFELTGFSSAHIITLVSILLIIVSLWALVKPMLFKAYQTDFMKQQLNGFKNNTKLFDSFLAIGGHFDIPENLVSIKLGSPEARTTITMASNLYCNPCGEAHKTLRKWLSYRDDISLEIIFTVSAYVNDPRIEVIEYLSALSLQTNDSGTIAEAIDDWYQNGHKLEFLMNKYPVKSTQAIKKVTKIQNEWLFDAQITNTPTFFINGQRLSHPYRLDDIEYLIA
ncbi:cysteine peptidase family C39 domain-containing protein [Pedobacter miscanthi]|uniref:Peptidase C39 domain-containing protein n=1 Tax=Pedobacter miscanthi TaxID=2259170 RepID=A0A366LC95_9SPHI|nr:cysteine peptidase family C39 domain-containing protein [Pedobacter miscanthi]RBQ11508.1 hypothetical protein DRW42_03330 [Pedobacter miscanthi]